MCQLWRMRSHAAPPRSSASASPKARPAYAQVDVVERRPREREPCTAWPDSCSAAISAASPSRRRARARAAATVDDELAEAGHALERARARRRRPARRRARPAASRPQRALQLVGRARGDDPAAVDDRELRGELVGLLEVVRREQDRHLLLLGQPRDLLPHLGSRLGVEARSSARRGRAPSGACSEPERDVEPALHAARVGLDARGRPPRSRPKRSSSSSTRRFSARPVTS